MTALQGGLSGAMRALFWAKKWPENQIFLRYTHITHLFWSQLDPTQWDHNIPISWGNSGYLRFSGRCPFSYLAGRCMAPPFLGEKTYIIPLCRMPSYDTAWNWIVFCGIALYLMVLHWYCMVLHGIARCCIVLYGMVLHCTIVGFGARAVSRKTLYVIKSLQLLMLSSVSLN